MYEFMLVLHSWLRWAVLIAGIAATLAGLIGADSNADRRTDRWGVLFVTFLDIQLLLGLLLYFFVSPITAAIREDFGAAMRDPIARFWAVEHVVLMLLAVVFAHLGRVLGRKAPTPERKRRRALICYGLAMIALVAATPWPGMSAGRPLFRF